MVFLPRLIDIARSHLPGGQSGDYWLGQGVSASLLKLWDLSKEAFIAIVAKAENDQQISAKVLHSISPERRHRMSAKLQQLTVEQVPDDQRTSFQRLYGTALPPTMTVFEVLAADDLRSFPASPPIHHIIQTADLPWEERRSPKGRFHLHRRHVSKALDCPRAQPFDLEMCRLPPGSLNFPYHAHATQWEMYIILSGSGIARLDGTERNIAAGDVLLCPPGQAHQLRNTGDIDLLYYVIADNPPLDVFHYPDSNKHGWRPDLQFFRIEQASYYEGEE
jgi:mannose-6-phosphate isomerase-like protein (cupin superfamily)